MKLSELNREGLAEILRYWASIFDRKDIDEEEMIRMVRYIGNQCIRMGEDLRNIERYHN